MLERIVDATDLPGLAAVATVGDRVVDVVPEFDLADDRAERLTVRHLLQQTSGLQDTGIPVVDAAASPDLTRYVSALSPGHLTADPGVRFAYCNANYDIAARVVEVASGVPFAEYMRAHIFDPLVMSDTTIGDADRPTSNGYISAYPRWLPVAENGRFFLGGAGGVVSTAADMGKWLLAQNGNRPDVFGSDC